MKKLFLLLTLLGMVAAGCSKDDTDKGNDNKTEQPNEDEGGSEDNIPENIFFGLDKESVTISPDGGSVNVIVYSNYKWEISGTSNWCTPSVKKGDANKDGQKVTFSADVTYDDREATFWFRCADEKIKFVVSQKSNNDIIYYTSSDGKIVTPYDSSAFGATILSNTYIDGVGAIEFDAPITTIGESAFYECSNLESVTISNSVTTIGDEAFAYCYSLASITIPDSVTTIGKSAFEYCWNLTSVTIPDSVTTIGEMAFAECSSLTSVTIPDSVTTIGEWAFQGCSSLTSVTIPDSLTTVGGYAFSGCENLEAVHITDLVAWCNIDFINPLTDESIDLSANPLWYAHNLYLNGELVTDLVIPDGVNEIKLMAFVSCNSIKSLTIPDSVTTIGVCAFYWCSSLTSVTIPDSVTTIGYLAFSDCISLTSVTIPDSVTTIGNGAFWGCISLTSVTIPDSVTTIGDSAFRDCSNLTSITIPDSVTTIGFAAFFNCSSLTSVYCKATTPSVAIIYYDYDGYWYAFDYNASGRKIYVPMESVEAYNSAEGWSEYASDIVGYNF